ncbi:MAG: hypothetical protein ABI203_01900 [Mucilaginibacter sp.]
MAQSESQYFIERVKIAEAYLKLELDFTTENIDQIKKILTIAAELNISEFNSRHNVKVEFLVDIEKGSLKGKVFVVLTTLGTILNYSTWRQSIKDIYHDSKWLTENIIQTAKQNPIVNNNTIRTEKRSGLIGRLKRTLDRINYLDNNINNLNNNQIHAELNALKQDISNIMNVLSEADRNQILNTLPAHIRNSLPAPTSQGEKHMYSLYALKPKDIEVEDEQ